MACPRLGVLRAPGPAWDGGWHTRSPKQHQSEAYEASPRAPETSICPHCASERLRHTPTTGCARGEAEQQADGGTLRRQRSRARTCDGIDQRATICEHTQRGKLTTGPLRSLRRAPTPAARAFSAAKGSRQQASSQRPLQGSSPESFTSSPEERLVRTWSESPARARLQRGSRISRGGAASQAIRPPPLGRVGSGGNSNK